MRLARASINKCASSGIIMEAYSEKLSSTSLSYDGRPGGEGTTGPTLLRCAFCHKLATELEVKLLEEGRAGERMSQLNESSEQLASGQTQDPASLIDSMTPSLSEINTEELQRKVADKKELLKTCQSNCLKVKDSLSRIIERKRILAEAQGRVLLARRRIELIKQVYESSKSSLQQEYECFKLLERGNAQREQRLKRVRQKNFKIKEAELSGELTKMHSDTERKMAELEKARRVFVTEMSRKVFPIEVDSLSERDDGEDYEAAGEIDCDASLDVDEGWVLSGMHRPSFPTMSIVTASLPSNGDYSAFIKTTVKRRKALSEAAQQGRAAPSFGQGDHHPTKDPLLSTPAALVYTAQLVELIANVLDQPLPYPISRKNAISQYGRSGQRRREFLEAVAKLDDNILYLCFSQNVPLSALTPGHTLQNLLGLITHSFLGRSGAFECHPELTRYRNKGGASSAVPVSHDFDDSEPPNVSYTDNQLTSSCHDDLDDDMESIDEGDSDDDEWEDPANYAASKEEDSEMESLVEIEKFETEWEHLEPSEQETRLFEEEQMKRQLIYGSSHDHAHQPLLSTSSHHQAVTEREIHRDRRRRLDYESTYMDFAASVASSGEAGSVHLTTTDTVRLFSSINKSDGDNEGASPAGCHDNDETDGEPPPSQQGQGFFGTLSNLWTSTFGGRAN